MEADKIIIILAVINALLALHLVNKKKEAFRMRVIDSKAQAIDPGFGLQLGEMQKIRGVAGVTADNGIDYDKAAQEIIDQRGSFGDLVSTLQRNWEAPYIKNLP